MFRPQLFLPYCQGTIKERFRIGILTIFSMQHRQIVHALERVQMLWTKGVLSDFQCALVELFCLMKSFVLVQVVFYSYAATRAIDAIRYINTNRRKVIKTGCHVWMFFP